MANTCTNLTEAARSVQLFRINGFTATKEKSEFIASRIWTVGGHDWQIDFQPERSSGDGRMTMRFSLVSRAKNVAASFSCCPVHPDSTRSPSQEKTVSSVFYQNKFVGLILPNRFYLEASGYVKDESFLVQCAINVLLREPTVAAVQEPCCSDLQKDLGELMRIHKGTDITFQVSGESIAAHRCVLVARSPVFAAELFGATMKDKSSSQCVEIKDMEAQVFKAMLHFIYTDTSLPELEETKGDHGKEMATRLLEAADRYGLERLKGICVEKVCTSIGVDTVATSLALAEQHRCSKLKDRCMNFILANRVNFHEISATDGYKHLEASYPSVLTEVLKLMVHRRHN